MKRLTAAAALAALSIAGCGYAQPGHHAMMMNNGSGMTGASRAAPETGDSAPADHDAPDGARLTRQMCGVCHAPPSPAQHSPEQWPSVVQRMRHYRHNYGLPKLSDEQVKAILNYLQGGNQP